MSSISDNTVSAILTPAGYKAVRSGHPWIFDKGIEKINKEGAAGDIAVLYDGKRKFAGIGIFDPHSPIKIRVLHTGKQISIDKDWLKSKISGIAAGRSALAESHDTNGYRLINGENDGLPALVLDRYADTLVLKTDSACWLPHIQTIVNIIIELFAPENIIFRMSRSVKEFSEYSDGSALYGSQPSDGVVFSENGIFFKADPVKGQKTGFFLDQRENRKTAGQLANGKKVLNVFSYNGGFSLYASKGGASSVTSLDISRQALDESVENYQLNPELDIRKHSIICGDAFEEMQRLIDEGVKYGMVIVDPPSFARKQQDTVSALKAYYKLSSMACRLLEKNGILTAASCSARVSASDFFNTVIKAVKASGRTFEQIKRTGHAQDHKAGFPEGEYLKCIFLQIK